MGICPVCNETITSMVCSNCGFDCSCDYVHYPTLSKIEPACMVVPVRTADRSGQENAFFCPSCGGNRFWLDHGSCVLVCSRCGAGVSTEEILENRKRSLRRTVVSQLKQYVSQSISRGLAAMNAGVSGKVNHSFIAASAKYTLILHSDGTVVVSEDGSWFGTKLWSGIAQIAVGAHHAVGLRKDGMVVTTGANSFGQCQTREWTNIVQIAAGALHTVGLRADGTVVATGGDSYGRCDVANWDNIAGVCAGVMHTVGLKKDGTVCAQGDNSYHQCDVFGWSNVIAIAAGWFHTVGLRRDGTVLVTGGHSRHEVADWTDIIAISASKDYTVGLRRDGSVFTTGKGEQRQVAYWTDVIAIAACADRTFGLCQDGRILSTRTDESNRYSINLSQG